MGKRPSISNRLVVPILTAAAARGVNGEGLCRAVGLDPKSLSDLDGRIDADQHLALWGEVMATVKEPGFPFEVALAGNEVHNFLQLVCMLSADLGEALLRASRFLRTVTNGVIWSLEDDGSIATMRIIREGPTQLVGFANEFSAATIVALGRRFTGVEWAPREVSFAHPAPSDIQAHLLFFRAPVRFSRPCTALHIDAPTLRLPLLKADPSMSAFLEQCAARIISAESPTLSHAEKVRRYVGRALHGDAPTIEDAAAELGMSARSLRRYLQAEGQTFQQLLDEVRLAVAKQHLEIGRLALSEIAFMLGFSALPAFHRAFRRWTGMTAQSYARAYRTTPSP